ncbi:MAG: zinc ABC transporter permease [Cytophagales bacterium]|nr:MAG: zinc ABC transporter permease [Cytophagales bacterium]TAF61881.1 MAG: zinc ABC transporter permease [Cytophagales bacterium]
MQEIWALLLEFLSSDNLNTQVVAAGCVILGACSALVGCFVVLRGQSLAGDVVSHAVLPGVCLAFLISGQKSIWLLSISACFTGWLALWLSDFITRQTRIKADTATAFTLSWFFGIGLVLLSLIQKSGNAAQTGLDHFLFGKAAAMLREDIYFICMVSFITLTLVVFFYPALKLYIFDGNFSKVSGLPIKWLEWLISTLTVMAVVVGVQCVGVVLMAALLVTPAIATRFWVKSLSAMLVLAAFIGSFSGFVGAFVSYTDSGIPTGPCIVLVATAIALFSFFVAPQKGRLFMFLKQRHYHLKITEENILKLFFMHHEHSQNFDQALSLQSIKNKRQFNNATFYIAWLSLLLKRYLQSHQNGFRLSPAGMQKAKRLVKLHRLWEVYLIRHAQMLPTQVHYFAETIEHIISPELEKVLEKELDYPKTDPHNKNIPY